MFAVCRQVVSYEDFETRELAFVTFEKTDVRIDDLVNVLLDGEVHTCTGVDWFWIDITRKRSKGEDKAFGSASALSNI